MDKIYTILKERGLPFVADNDGENTVVVYAVGYTPFLYQEDEFEIGAFYLASHEAYTLFKELEKTDKRIETNPKLDYKKTAERLGLGVRGYNDLIFTPEFGSLCALGAVKVKGVCDRVSREVSPLGCENCGVCQKLCPNKALNGGFDYQKCIRRQMDDGIENGVEKLLSKSILGCNVCSVNCPKNAQNRVRPPEIMQKMLKIDEFFTLALSGKREIMPLGELIGHNMIRPARMLTLATYALQNLPASYTDRWIDKLSEYPDERVKRAVKFLKSSTFYN